MNNFLFMFVILTISFVNACNATNSTITFTYDQNILLTFVESSFDSAAAKPTDCGDGYICLINNKPFWGTDGKSPKSTLSRTYITIKDHEIELDTTGMYNPLVSDTKKANYQVVHYFGDAWKVRGIFSDGAGAYYAEWLVHKTGSIRILLGDAELIHDAFDNIKN